MRRVPENLKILRRKAASALCAAVVLGGFALALQQDPTAPVDPPSEPGSGGGRAAPLEAPPNAPKTEGGTQSGGAITAPQGQDTSGLIGLDGLPLELLAEWERWWRYHEHEYLDARGRARIGTVLEGSDEDYLGRGER